MPTILIRFINTWIWKQEHSGDAASIARLDQYDFRPDLAGAWKSCPC